MAIMHWDRLKPAPNFFSWVFLLAAIVLGSISAFVLGGLGIGLAVTAALTFGLAWFSREDQPANGARR